MLDAGHIVLFGVLLVVTAGIIGGLWWLLK